MEFDILQNIREIFHGLGEKSPSVVTVKEIQSVLLKQMALLIYKTHQIAISKGGPLITIRHIVYALRYNKLTLTRMLIYYLLKDNFQKITTNNSNSILKENQSFDHDMIDCITNTKTRQHFKDPMKFLMSLNFKSSTCPNYGRMSLFWQIFETIKELKLEMKITQEDIDNATFERQARVDKVSIELSKKRYEVFQICRRENFQLKVGRLLLSEVGRALPKNVKYNKEAKELFLFLAKESIACIYDRVCENKKLKNQNPMNNVESLKSEYTEPNDITSVTNAIWDPALGDICFPYVENNAFFSNSPIFD